MEIDIGSGEKLKLYPDEFVITQRRGGKAKMERIKDVTVEVDTIREEMPPALKKKLFPDDEPQ